MLKNVYLIISDNFNSKLETKLYYYDCSKNDFRTNRIKLLGKTYSIHNIKWMIFQYISSWFPNSNVFFSLKEF